MSLNRFLNHFHNKQTKPSVTLPSTELSLETTTPLESPNAASVVSANTSLFEVLKSNQSSCKLSELIVKLPQGDFALAYSNGVSTGNDIKIGIYIFSKHDLKEKAFIPYPQSRFLKLFISEGRLVTTCYHVEKKSMVLNQWSADFKIESELLIPRFTSFLPATEPGEREPGLRFASPYDLMSTYQIPKYTFMTMLKGNRLMCQSPHEKTIYFIDLKNNRIEDRKIEYGLNKNFFNPGEMIDGCLHDRSELGLEFLRETDKGLLFYLYPCGSGIYGPSEKPLVEIVTMEDAYVCNFKTYQHNDLLKHIVATQDNKYLATSDNFVHDSEEPINGVIYGSFVSAFQQLEKKSGTENQLEKTAEIKIKGQFTLDQQLVLPNGMMLVLGNVYRPHNNIYICDVNHFSKLEILVKDRIKEFTLMGAELLLKTENDFKLFRLNHLHEFLLQQTKQEGLSKAPNAVMFKPEPAVKAGEEVKESVEKKMERKF